MVIFFGPPGAGKSVQGQLLAKSHGWQWVSTGQLLRESTDERLHAIMERGELLSDDDMNEVIKKALDSITNLEEIILDGYPRKISQVDWLNDYLKNRGSRIQAIISLEVSTQELLNRLSARGRTDDSAESLRVRTEEYVNKTQPVLSHLRELQVPILKIDGIGSVEDIQARVEKAL